ncbi:hypothetical protein CHELA20_10567 [Hyphomicrobiales bacterium]|nr:hypothetical protein CHELA20_10567 [Hyphomicrobiales bacterium]CAH1692792.1 hypothetical protein CHELA41_50796 [Hyphomicrobiales bacterium]
MNTARLVAGVPAGRNVDRSARPESQALAGAGTTGKKLIAAGSFPGLQVTGAPRPAQSRQGVGTDP